MNDSIPDRAEQVLKDLDMWRLPVRPVAIAREEGIELSSGHFGERFDARIEYYTAYDAYCIYHEAPGGWRTEGRVRFSLAHELGHYYLPKHRERLRSGVLHNSVCDFRSRDSHEQEADEFAASLLMPMELFRSEIDRFRCGFCNLRDLGRLADRLGTSLTSTARRYCQCDREPCTVFFSENGRIRWGVSSSDMQTRQMYFYPYGQSAPAGSKTAILWEQLGDGETVDLLEGSVAAHVWFERPRARVLWEEIMLLGNTGIGITQLTPES